MKGVCLAHQLTSKPTPGVNRTPVDSPRNLDFWSFLPPSPTCPPLFISHLNLHGQLSSSSMVPSTILFLSLHSTSIMLWLKLTQSQAVDDGWRETHKPDGRSYFNAMATKLGQYWSQPRIRQTSSKILHLCTFSFPSSRINGYEMLKGLHLYNAGTWRKRNFSRNNLFVKPPK